LADLFPETAPSEIRRSAHFVGDLRLSLTRDWGNRPDARRALAIGCNPSAADAQRDDPTSRWWNKWFMSNGYSGYDAMNLYPFCTPHPKACRAFVEKHPRKAKKAMTAINLPALLAAANKAETIFVCWGNIAWDQKWISHVVSELQAVAGAEVPLYCWGITKSGAPKHPLARGKHRITATQTAKIWSGQ